MDRGWVLVAVGLVSTLVVAAPGCESRSADAACNDDTDCDEGELCEDYECVPADEVTSGSGSGDPGSSGTSGGGDDLCTASCAAGVEACSLSDSVMSACVDDCRKREAAQPEACRAQWDAGLKCQGEPSAWTCDAGIAIATACEEHRIAQETCIWNGDFCELLGGSTTPAGGCGITCTATSGCPLGILSCAGVGYCTVSDNEALGCGPDGWLDQPWGCELECSEEGADHQCPAGNHCWYSSTGGEHFFCGT